jgi:hypothetical protein
MQLLCDQNVAERYIDACIEAPDLQAIAGGSFRPNRRCYRT